MHHHHDLVKLYQLLSISEILELEVYAHYIVQLLPDMTDAALLKHLTNLSRKLQPDRPCSNSRKITNALRNLAVVGTQGRRKRATEFYDPDNIFLKTLLPADVLLPLSYRY